MTNPTNYHYGQFPPSGLDYAALMTPMFETTQAITRYDQMLARMHNTSLFLTSARSQEAVISSRMEGTISTLDEVLEIQGNIQEMEDEDAFQTARSEAVETFLHARAMNMAEAAINTGQPISEHLIKSAHQVLLLFGRGREKNPGGYKRNQNYVGEKRRGAVSFVPISPQALPGGMAELINYINADQINPLIRAAIAHVEFEALHPFEDGNGRIGRMLITLMLWQNGVIRAPHFYVSARFEELRDDYIDNMRRVSSHGEWTEWCIFFLQTLTEQAERNTDTIMRVFQLYEDMQERFRQELNSAWAQNALDFIFANPNFLNSQFTKRSGIPPHVARDFSRKLRDAGLIEERSPAAGRRPARYVFRALINAIEA